MKTCPICGHQYPDDLKECPVCGTAAPSGDEKPEENKANENNGMTPPPIPENNTTNSDEGPKTRISEPPVGGYSVPPTGGGSTVPPSNGGYGQEPPRRNNTALWIVIAVLSAIILVGATCLITLNCTGHNDDNDSTSDTTDTNDIEVLDYSTDDTPSEEENNDYDESTYTPQEEDADTAVEYDDSYADTIAAY